MSKRKAEEPKPESTEDAAKRQKCEALAAFTAAALVYQAIDKLVDAQTDKIRESYERVKTLARTMGKATNAEYAAACAAHPELEKAKAVAACDRKSEADDKNYELEYNAEEQKRKSARAIHKALMPKWEQAEKESVAAQNHLIAVEAKLLDVTKVLSLCGVAINASQMLYAVRVERANGLVREVVHGTSAEILKRHVGETQPVTFGWYIVSTNETRTSLKFHALPPVLEMKFKLHASGMSRTPDPNLFYVSIHVKDDRMWTIPQAFAMLTALDTPDLVRLEDCASLYRFIPHVMDHVTAYRGVMWHIDSPGVVLSFDDDNDTHTDAAGKPAPGGNALSAELDAARSAGALVICP